MSKKIHGDSPPIEISKRDILYGIDVQLHVAVNLLAPCWELGESKIPLSITALQQLAGTVEGLLEVLAFLMVDRDDVVAFSKGLKWAE